MAGAGEIANVGQGHIDWNRIFAKRREAGIEHFFVEHDDPKSPIDGHQGQLRLSGEIGSMSDRESGTGNWESATRRRDSLAASGAHRRSAALAAPVSPSSRLPCFPHPASRSQSASSSPPPAGATTRSRCREFAKAAKRIGLAGVDLLQPDEWDVVRDAGLVCSMGYPTDRKDFLSVGFNDRANHAMLLKELERTIPLAAQHRVPNVIAMFGNRAGKTDSAGIAASIEGLSKIKPLAEQHGVTVCVELLNSKVDHKDYQGDHTAFGVEVMKGVGSPRVKLLYDIYHMQIMEGDVIRTIRDNIAYIGHFHTGGVPGRHELDDTQELNWRAIANAIADTNYTGFVAHEFVPTRRSADVAQGGVRGVCGIDETGDGTTGDGTELGMLQRCSQPREPSAVPVVPYPVPVLFHS